MHDDQHGTAIIAGAGLVNAMEVVGKDIAEAKIVVRQLEYSCTVCAFAFSDTPCLSLLAVELLAWQSSSTLKHLEPPALTWLGT